ncbi:hypothetical protein VTL71DRAFT_3617 [Oculimacula yallundae]|uniref:Uncharacterized protein n=1 Tax=Oculimacula yallundae TaxID=86028 RepID=A0ABR4C7P4_9HELO
MPGHNILARVWILLQARVDIVSITREILGQLLLDLRSSDSSAPSYDFFVWMKVIFDLQRTYSQSLNPSSTTRCYMLPQELLFNTIEYTVHVRPGQQSRQSNLGKPDFARRFYASRVVLSGLRALQLRQKDAQPHIQESRLQKLYELVQSWSYDAEEYPAEHFILTQCQRAISHIKLGPGTNSVWHLPASSACKLRDVYDGLYPAIDEGATSAFVSQLQLLRADYEPPFYEPAFWALYDILWAAEVGDLQWEADRFHHHAGFMEGTRELKALTEMIEPKTPERLSITILKHTWKRDLDESEPVGALLESSLQSLATFLNSRQGTLVDYNSDIRHIHHQLTLKTESWIRNVCGLRDDEAFEREEELPTKLYILGCPKLHVVPENDLRSRLNIIKEDTAIPEFLDLTSSAYPTMHCPRCGPERTPDTIVLSARMIEPLHYINNRLLSPVKDVGEVVGAIHHPRQVENIPSSAADPPIQRPLSGLSDFVSFENQQNLLAAQTSRGEANRKHSTSTFPTPNSTSPPVSPRKNSVESVAISISMSETRRGFRALFGKKATPPPTPPPPAVTPIFDHYGFSIDGNMLLLWNEVNIYFSVIPATDAEESLEMWKWKSIPIPKVAFVVAGGERVVAVARLGVDRYDTLQTFYSSHTTGSDAIISKRISPHGQVRSIAMSRSGNFVAVGSDQAVQIYDVNNSNAPTRRVTVSNQGSYLNSQRMNFSKDEKILAIASRSNRGLVEVVVYDRVAGEDIWRRAISAESSNITDEDHGLSSIFYDEVKERIVLTGYTNRQYRLLHSKRVSFLEWAVQNGKIQAAASCTPTSKFVLLTGTGKFYELDASQNGSFRLLTIKTTTSRAPKAPNQFVALAIPEEGRMYTFRNNNNTMLLEVILGNESSKTKPIRLPRLDTGG